jgi:hypothetical protein
MTNIWRRREYIIVRSLTFIYTISHNNQKYMLFLCLLVWYCGGGAGIERPLMVCYGHGGPPYSYNLFKACMSAEMQLCDVGVRFISWDNVHLIETPKRHSCSQGAHRQLLHAEYHHRRPRQRLHVRQQQQWLASYHQLAPPVNMQLYTKS